MKDSNLRSSRDGSTGRGTHHADVQQQRTFGSLDTDSTRTLAPGRCLSRRAGLAAHSLAAQDGCGEEAGERPSYRRPAQLRDVPGPHLSRLGGEQLRHGPRLMGCLSTAFSRSVVRAWDLCTVDIEHTKVAGSSREALAWQSVRVPDASLQPGCGGQPRRRQAYGGGFGPERPSGGGDPRVELEDDRPTLAALVRAAADPPSEEGAAQPDRSTAWPAPRRSRTCGGWPGDGHLARSSTTPTARAGDEIAPAPLAAGLRRVEFRPTVLRDVSAVDTSTTILGRPAALPLVFAPTGLHPDDAHRGRAGCRPGGRADRHPLRTVHDGHHLDRGTRGCGARRVDAWFQLYLWRDRRGEPGLRRAGP